MPGKIFINYRRDDDPGFTGRLFDRLQDAFDRQQLFIDVDNIAPGQDFVRVLHDRVAECDVVLVVIGKGWLDARDANGARRLDDPEDFVRIEISSALSQDNKRVIPVLVRDTPMPRADLLPEVLKPLARLNAVRLTHERFPADMQGLTKSIQQTLAELGSLRAGKATATAPAPPAKTPARTTWPRLVPLVALAATVIAVLAAAAVYWANMPAFRSVALAPLRSADHTDPRVASGGGNPSPAMFNNPNPEFDDQTGQTRCVARLSEPAAGTRPGPESDRTHSGGVGRCGDGGGVRVAKGRRQQLSVLPG